MKHGSAMSTANIEEPVLRNKIETHALSAREIPCSAAIPFQSGLSISVCLRTHMRKASCSAVNSAMMRYVR